MLRAPWRALRHGFLPVSDGERVGLMCSARGSSRTAGLPWAGTMHWHALPRMVWDRLGGGGGLGGGGRPRFGEVGVRGRALLFHLLCSARGGRLAPRGSCGRAPCIRTRCLGRSGGTRRWVGGLGFSGLGFSSSGPSPTAPRSYASPTRPPRITGRRVQSLAAAQEWGEGAVAVLGFYFIFWIQNTHIITSSHPNRQATWPSGRPSAFRPFDDGASACLQAGIAPMARVVRQRCSA